jgi:hypothetical protein
MKENVRHDPLPDALEQELIQEVVDDLLRRLIAGSGASGVSLSAQECKVLLAELRPKPKPSRGRPPVDWDQQCELVMTCMGYRWRGLSARAAVTATAKAHGVSPSTVWKARKLFDRSK